MKKKSKFFLVAPFELTEEEAARGMDKVLSQMSDTAYREFWQRLEAAQEIESIATDADTASEA
jgi:hypothetical protein